MIILQPSNAKDVIISVKHVKIMIIVQLVANIGKKSHALAFRDTMMMDLLDSAENVPLTVNNVVETAFNNVLNVITKENYLIVTVLTVYLKIQEAFANNVQ